ncbi:MAG TPA: diguanylate cyclase [Gaiellaceae bacterium]|nr:diguanylate cyclase [Gaiellaceae bacterium]
MVVAHARFGDPSASPLDKGDALALLGFATAELLTSSEASELLELIVQNVVELAGTPHAYLSLMEPDGRFTVRAGTGVFENLVGYHCPPGGGVSGCVSDDGDRATVTGHATWSPRCREAAELAAGPLVEIPLSMRSRGRGTLGAALIDEGHTFAVAQIDLLAQYGQFAALALENAHLDGLARAELRERRRVEEELLDMIAWLERSEDELRNSRAETIARLAHAAEFRNLETGAHVERMSRYCAALASRLGLHDDRVDVIRMASTLHDVGKIAIPDEVLLKPGPLTSEERHVIQQHPTVGHELLTASSSEILEVAAAIALTHHERFDGTGYPNGLVGEEIPLEGRIAAVADVFDALRSDRVYRPAMSFDQAVELMQAGRGTQFDPEILDLFMECLPEIEGAVAGVVLTPDPVPAPVEVKPFRQAKRTSDDAEMIDANRLRESCSEALDVLAQVGSGKEAIDLAVSCLARGWEGKLIVSVYLLEHQRLWVIAQRGYADVVYDGFPVTRGVMARAIRTGETQFVHDVALDADFVGAASGIVSEVAIPFPTELPVGVLNVETLGIKLPEEAASIFGELAEALAARLEVMRQGLGLDIASLARLCVHASSLHGVSAISEFATRTFGRFLGLESAQLVLRSSDGSSRSTSHWRRPDSEIAPISPEGLELLDQVRLREAAVAAFGVLPASELGWGSEGVEDAPWAVWLPLRVSGNEIGALVGRSSSREIDREHIEAGSLIAQHAAALIDIAQRLRREQRAAATDPLTGLLNRRGFEERFTEELARAARHGESLALVMIDCDGLKGINDLDGHEIGDQALQYLAACVRSGKRVSDVAARFGGDEFAVVITDIDAEGATAAAERIRESVAAGFPYSEHRLSASFGIAVYPTQRRPAELLSAADAALYRAKREGGDCVRLAD